ncbi:aegerolysin family protein [Actinoallomurus purpureus]|uniref:aegerolysin family protein n=1 Tax=Actinoallomurus purpureus TaxID=478114 RepID=UPI0020933A89|nr:aegerolysin family protein [Actinoallomurus purpureus]MCO6011230.1 aegerolysin family protein [Actinoallomurus purpureus]
MGNMGITARTGIRTAVAAAVLGGGLLASIPSASADSARSVEVFLNNLARCDLLLVTARLDHGEWEVRPPQLILLGDQGRWESVSHGIGTGTEGEADYFTQSCRNPAHNNKRIHFHWDNPFFGSNSYDSAGTDGAFRSNIVGGSGNHAGVSVSFLPV